MSLSEHERTIVSVDQLEAAFLDLGKGVTLFSVLLEQQQFMLTLAGL
jgi:hypothetical protein